MARQTKSYHHGDLRQALLQAGLAMLEEYGLEGLSLRKIAARVGVSHAAPEHHFPTLRHLLNAMASEGFHRFGVSMLDTMRAAPADAVDQMRAALQGYLAFARGNPHLFRLMFNSGMLDWSDRVLEQRAVTARQVLTDICAPAADHLGLKTPGERLGVEQLVWSHVHGYAHLVIDGKFEGVDDSKCEGPAVPFDLAALLFRR